MPSRNSVKEYVADSYYHIYNRGIDKRVVFQDRQDYSVFISLLHTAVTSVENRKEVMGTKAKQAITRRFDLSDDIKINAYCLLPNHFHLLVFTKSGHGISQFMQSISNAYVRFFNTKYGRVGPLFQGRYKAVRINNDAQAAHITRYIHLNALDARQSLEKYPYSSFRIYADPKAVDWIDKKSILRLLHMNSTQYIKFVKSYIKTKHDLKILKKEIAKYLEL